MSLTVHTEAKALIFDLDGTLSDSLPVHVATWNAVGEKYGFIFDPRIIHEMTGMPTIAFARRIVEQYELDESPEKIVKIKQQLFWDMAHLLQPIVEVTSLLHQYKGILPMAVGTGASRKSAMVQLETLQLTSFFDVIISADDVEFHKPEPHTFLKCAEIMKVEPRLCQVFEDGDLGIEAAKRAGMMITDIRPYINYGNWDLNRPFGQMPQILKTVTKGKQKPTK